MSDGLLRSERAPRERGVAWWIGPTGRPLKGLLMASSVSSHDQSSIQEQLVQAFSDFLPAWTKWLRTTLHQSGVTPARVRLLAVLADGPAVTMTSLSKALHVSPRNITTLVDALEAEGLVRRVDHPTDRRATIIELTDRGAELCENLWSQHLDGAGRIFSAIVDDDQRQLLSTVQTLRGALREKGID